MITLEIDTSLAKRGPGVWKLNEDLLNDETLCAKVESLIRELTNRYNYMSPVELWELIKDESRQILREESKWRAYFRKCEQFSLYKKLSSIQERLLQENTDVIRTCNQASFVTEEIKSFEVQNAKRAAFRCRQQWMQHGERSSKYYFNLEKRNYLS